MLCAECAAGRPSGGGDRQPPRVPEDRRDGRASAGSCTRSRRARWRTSSRTAERQGIAADLPAGRFRLHGGARRRRREGIIRAGAEMVETMACATVPKIVLTLNHASGAGYYAMAGQGFDPNFTFSLADGAHRRDGGRFGGAGAVLGRNWRSMKARASVPDELRAAHREDARRLRALAGRALRRRARPLRRDHRSAGDARGCSSFALEASLHSRGTGSHAALEAL